ncbi:hypothetical protein ACT4US_37245, partial [Bacillus sp. HC-Mk]
ITNITPKCFIRFKSRCRWILSFNDVYVRDSEEFLRELNKLAVITINNLKKENVNSWGILKREVREALGK